MTPPPKRSGTAGLRPRCCEDLKRRVSEACGVTEGGPKEALGALRTAGGAGRPGQPRRRRPCRLLLVSFPRGWVAGDPAVLNGGLNGAASPPCLLESAAGDLSAVTRRSSTAHRLADGRLRGVTAHFRPAIGSPRRRWRRGDDLAAADEPASNPPPYLALLRSCTAPTGQRFALWMSSRAG